MHACMHTFQGPPSITCASAGLDPGCCTGTGFLACRAVLGNNNIIPCGCEESCANDVHGAGCCSDVPPPGTYTCRKYVVCIQ